MPQFGALHVLTDQQGVSLDALATDLGLPVSQVAFWLIGHAPVPESLVGAVAAVLGVHPTAVREHSHTRELRRVHGAV